MDMTKGRISPTGGQTGHGHPVNQIFDNASLMRVPSAAVEAQIAAATTVAALRTALQAWIAEQP